MPAPAAMGLRRVSSPVSVKETQDIGAELIRRDAWLAPVHTSGESVRRDLGLPVDDCCLVGADLVRQEFADWPGPPVRATRRTVGVVEHHVSERDAYGDAGGLSPSEDALVDPVWVDADELHYLVWVGGAVEAMVGRPVRSADVAEGTDLAGSQLGDRSASVGADDEVVENHDEQPF